MSKILSDDQRLHLQKMMTENDVEDNTANIKMSRHSEQIRMDVNNLLFIKSKHKELAEINPEEFDNMCIRECSFLFNNYTDIFNKIKKDIIDLKILEFFLKTLKQIEDGTIDQHEGSYLVGELLKKIYVDSALRREKKLDEEASKSSDNKKQTREVKSKNVSYRQYKQLIENCEKSKINQ